MDDKDRALVEQVLHAAGTAGQEGFAAMVRYQWAEGLTDILGSVFAIFVLCAVTFVVFRLKLKYWEDGDRVGLRLMVSISATIIVCVIFATGFMSGVKQMIAPEGAAIHSVLHR